ncbi:hypothetical protein BDV97DRAFT_360569 [Delphinella strobiligena]|nr:hypothetical protein BDV97DRAFT_360569 [Delphinella strobiligena]
MEKLKRHQRDSNPDDYKNPYIQAPEENGVESVHMSSPPSVASTDHVVVKSSPTTVQTVLKMPSRSLHTGSDLPSPYQVLSTLPQVRLDPAIAKVHRAKWSAAEEQAILALVCKHTLPGSKTVHNWDKLMAEYNANGGRREAKALQMKVHRTDPRIKRGGSNNRGKAIKAKKAAMLTKANGGSV